MENQQIVSQFELHKTKLQNIKTFSEFVIWSRTLIDLTNTHAPNLTAILSGLELLRKVPSKPKTSNRPQMVSQYLKKPNNDNLVPSKKEKANEYINQIIDYIKQNPIKYDKKSYWETHFTVNSLGTLWIATIALLLTATLVGYPVCCTMGRNAGKDEMQRQVNILSTQKDDLTQKDSVLRDSFAMLQIELKKCKSIPSDKTSK